jgi:hypothetical protein
MRCIDRKTTINETTIKTKRQSTSAHDIYMVLCASIGTRQSTSEHIHTTRIDRNVYNNEKAVIKREMNGGDID